MAFTGSGLPLWRVQVPVIPPTDADPFTPVSLPGDRVLVGAGPYGYDSGNSNYAQEIWVVDSSSGRVLNNYTDSFHFVYNGGSPSAPSTYAGGGHREHARTRLQ